jgi:hypothetical protein
MVQAAAGLLIVLVANRVFEPVRLHVRLVLLLV